MIAEATELADAFAQVYRSWVLHAASVREWDVDPSLTDALEVGEAWLGDELVGLLAQPFADQRRGPLEIFQEAMKFPTAALASTGTEPVQRDPAAVAALPGDVFDLAPASSALLGEEVWQKHLVWGAAKARSHLQA